MPKWAGATWIAGAVMFFVLGVVLGQATTGSSLPTQSVGALLLAASGGWMAYGARRRPSAAAVTGAAQPLAS